MPQRRAPMHLPNDFCRCAPLDECPWADKCARLRDTHDAAARQLRFTHLGPPLDAWLPDGTANTGSKCHNFVNCPQPKED